MPHLLHESALLLEFASYSMQAAARLSWCLCDREWVSHLSSACKKSLLLQLARSNHEQYTAYTGQTYVLLASKLTRPTYCMRLAGQV